MIRKTQSRSNKRQTFYDFINNKETQNLDLLHDREEHRWRRHVWDKALNTKGSPPTPQHAIQWTDNPQP
jgi:hypothetical protein